MKKILTLALAIVFIFTAAACKDKKSTDDSINVVFYTPVDASEVENLYQLEAGVFIEKPEDPTREGYIFNGWFKDLAHTQPWVFETDQVGDYSIVLYSDWIPAIFQIIYDSNGGTLPATYPTEFKTGQNVILPSPTRTGYQFAAWYLYDQNVEGTKPGDKGYQSIPQNYVGDFIIYAHYTVIKVTVTFNVNFPEEVGGPVRPNSKVVSYGDIIDFTTYSDTAGYKFLGWNSSSAGTGTWYINGEEFIRTQRLTLYGIWEKI